MPYRDLSDNQKSRYHRESHDIKKRASLGEMRVGKKIACDQEVTRMGIST